MFFFRAGQGKKKAGKCLLRCKLIKPVWQQAWGGGTQVEEWGVAAKDGRRINPRALLEEKYPSGEPAETVHSGTASGKKARDPPRILPHLFIIKSRLRWLSGASCKSSSSRERARWA